MDIPNTDSVNYAFASAQSQAMQYRHEFITPEHLLSALPGNKFLFKKAFGRVFLYPRKNCPSPFPNICRKKWNEFLKK